MMEVLIAVTATMAVLLLAVLFILLSRKAPDHNQQLIEMRNQLEELKLKQLEGQNQAMNQQQTLLLRTQSELREQLNTLLKTMGENLNATQGNIDRRLHASNEVIGEIQKKLGSLEVTTKNLQDIGKDIASLQEILSAPKLRGNLGEYLLDNLLKDIFPADKYGTQVSFRDGTKVDALITLGDGKIPIDSKFPMESFSRMVSTDNEEAKKAAKREFMQSVKKRIDEIAKNYIKPAEGTYDFAMMYIPAENVFYEIIVNDAQNNNSELLNYAMKSKVIPVSPNSFYAYLMAIVYGLKGMRVEQQAKQLMGELNKVQTQFGRFFEDYNMVGKHLGNAQNKFDESRKRAERLNDQMGKITGTQTELVEDTSQPNLLN